MLFDEFGVYDFITNRDKLNINSVNLHPTAQSQLPPHDTRKQNKIYLPQL